MEQYIVNYETYYIRIRIAACSGVVQWSYATPKIKNVMGSYIYILVVAGIFIVLLALILIILKKGWGIFQAFFVGGEKNKMNDSDNR